MAVLQYQQAMTGFSSMAAMTLQLGKHWLPQGYCDTIVVIVAVKAWAGRESQSSADPTESISFSSTCMEGV